MCNIEKHVFNITRYLYESLKCLKHRNGNKVAEIYCEEDQWNIYNHGSIINFNLLYSDGSYIGYSHVRGIIFVLKKYI